MFLDNQMVKWSTSTFVNKITIGNIVGRLEQ